MSDRAEGIVCRRCDAVYPVAEGNCPECGTRDRGYVGPAVVIAVGLGFLVPSLSPLDLFYAGVGLAILAVGISAVRDRRRRLAAASQRR